MEDSEQDVPKRQRLDSFPASSSSSSHRPSSTQHQKHRILSPSPPLSQRQQQEQQQQQQQQQQQEQQEQHPPQRHQPEPQRQHQHQHQHQHHHHHHHHQQQQHHHHQHNHQQRQQPPQHAQAQAPHHAEAPPVTVLQHSYPGGPALRPPSAYNQPPPPSPYISSPAHESRPLSGHSSPPRTAVPALSGATAAPSYPPGSASGPSPHSGYSTPMRDNRPPPLNDPYARHDGHSASLRSPEEIPHSGAHHSSHHQTQQPPPLPPPPLSQNLHQQPPGVGGSSHHPPPPHHPAAAPLRPINTAIDVDGPHYSMAGTSHESGPPDPSVAYVHHDPMTNGISHGLPMSVAHHDPVHGPPPMSAYSDSHVPLGSPYSAGPFTPAHSHQWMARAPVPLRRNARAQQACEVCRSRKAKCDEGKPQCSYCKENGHKCHYKEVQPAKADRAQRELLDEIRYGRDQLGTFFDNMGKHFQAFSDNITTILRAPRYEVRLNEPPGQRRIMHPTLEPAYPQPSEPVAAHSTHYEDEEQPEPRMELDVPHLHGEEPLGHTGSIHVDHTTGAHNLIKWPNIKALVGDKVTEDFVMRLEEKKGLLRVFGRGQGIDRWDGASTGPGSPAGSSSGDESRSPIGAAPDLWGYGLGLPTSVEGMSIRKDNPGGLNQDGTLRLDKVTMYELEKSYLENLHILHPFLDKSRLRRMIDKVWKTANPHSEARQHRSPHNTIAIPGQGTRPPKRKYSADESAHESSAGFVLPQEQRLERRISTAIVLLVMALGRICLETNDLPGPASEIPRDLPVSVSSGSPYNHIASPAAAVSSPGSSTTIGGDGRRTSLTNTPDPRPIAPPKPRRNVDVIPGLAYYARATEMLGTLQGNDLLHVQANILAALYTSQLACVIESWTWISHACRACKFLVREVENSKARDLRQTEADKTRIDLIRFAYWTCHQLEGDILAELDLSPSGIKAFEGIGLPKGISERPDEMFHTSAMMVFYSSQTHLRTNLNNIQDLLYAPHATKVTFVQRNACDEMLEQWRGLVPDMIRWNDNNPPASGILEARLRAKYYGAKYIVHRPFLKQVMESEMDLREPQVLSKFSDYRKNPSPDWLQQSCPPNMPSSVWEKVQFLISCHLCIEAAKRSTTALDGIIEQRRLVVTNIFGTAHAQFGNMLVLSAVSKSKNVSWLLDRSDLLKLLKRTIKFLQSLAPISTTLAADASILEGIRKQVEDRPLLTTSFSSVSSAQ